MLRRLQLPTDRTGGPHGLPVGAAGFYRHLFPQCCLNEWLIGRREVHSNVLGGGGGGLVGGRRGGGIPRRTRASAGVASASVPSGVIHKRVRPSQH